jgi:hypothetical protein
VRGGGLPGQQAAWPEAPTRPALAGPTCLLPCPGRRLPRAAGPSPAPTPTPHPLHSSWPPAPHPPAPCPQPLLWPPPHALRLAPGPDRGVPEPPPPSQRYLDGFPFPFYILLRDIASLPRTLADLLRQWFELSTGH